MFDCQRQIKNETEARKKYSDALFRIDNEVKRHAFEHKRLATFIINLLTL